MSIENIRRRLHELSADALAAARGHPACVWVNVGESKEKAMDRWLAERPGQDPVRDNRKVIFIQWGTAATGTKLTEQSHG